MPHVRSIESVQIAVEALRDRVRHGIPSARSDWGGAGVVITSRPLDAGYREIVTSHAREVSWLFLQLRDAFWGVVDSCTKFEFYGRLELAANRTIRADRAVSPLAMCLAVIDEAEAIADEMSAGNFVCLALAVGSSIAADFVKEAS